MDLLNSSLTGQGFWGTGQKGHSFQGNNYNIGQQRTKEKQIFDFWGSGQLTSQFIESREQVPALGWPWD